MAVVFDGILNRTPTPAAQLNRALPPQVGAIISKALQKDRNVRYQSASEILIDLEAYSSPLQTKIAVSSSVNPSVFGQAVTFTATVSVEAPASGRPVGTVRFLDGASPLGRAALDSSGEATLITSVLAAGWHSITTAYEGGDRYSESTSSVLDQIVTKASTTTELGLTATVRSVFGRLVSFLRPEDLTASVTALAPGSGTPAGTVKFQNGARTLGARKLDASSRATLSGPALSVGPNWITAEYGGDGNFEGSTSPVLHSS